MSSGFAGIPIRQNGIDQLIEASWFNTIRTKLIEAFGSGAYIKVQTTQTIAASGTFTVDEEAFKPFIPVVGDGGPVTMSNLPFGSPTPFQDGKEIIIMGTSDTNTVTLVSNNAADGLILNGAQVTLKQYNKINLMYWAEGGRFIELERNF